MSQTKINPVDQLTIGLSGFNWLWFVTSGTYNTTPITASAGALTGIAYTVTYPSGAPYPTLYRFIPSPYINSGDGFYTTLNGSVLTGLICTRATL